MPKQYGWLDIQSTCFNELRESTNKKGVGFPGENHTPSAVLRTDYLKRDILARAATTRHAAEWFGRQRRLIVTTAGGALTCPRGETLDC